MPSQIQTQGGKHRKNVLYLCGQHLQRIHALGYRNKLKLSNKLISTNKVDAIFVGIIFILSPGDINALKGTV